MIRWARGNQSAVPTWALALLAFGFPCVGQADVDALNALAASPNAEIQRFVPSVFGVNTPTPLVPLSHDPGDGEPLTPAAIPPDLLGRAISPWTLASLLPYLTDQQEALLGCGPFYGTQCDLGGIDLMNMEGSGQIMSWPQFDSTSGQVTWDTTDGSLIQPGTVGYEGGPVCTRFEDGELHVLPGCRGPGDPGYVPDVDGSTTGPGSQGLTYLGGRRHPFTGQPWANEMAIVSWNTMMVLIALSSPPDDADPGDLGLSYFDPEDPFRTDGCSFAAPAFCANVAAVLGHGIRAPEGTFRPVSIDDDPLFGGYHQIDEDVDGVTVTGEFLLEGNGDIEGDFQFDEPGCSLGWGPVNGFVKEWGSVARLKMKGPISGDCVGASVGGKAKIKGEIDSSGDFVGTISVKACARGRCDDFEESFFFELGAQEGGSWRLKVKDVEAEGARLSGKCNLRLDGSPDRLTFRLAGIYDGATGTSALECEGRGPFSEGAEVKIEGFVASDGEIVSGDIDGTVFGQKIDTRVPDA
jgi:hypothetical protein